MVVALVHSAQLSRDGGGGQLGVASWWRQDGDGVRGTKVELGPAAAG
jgi:hypothetical protein